MDAEINYIRSEVKFLNKDQREKILEMIDDYGLGEKIMEKANGSHVNLDKLPERLIIQIHNYMKRKIESAE